MMPRTVYDDRTAWYILSISDQQSLQTSIALGVKVYTRGPAMTNLVAREQDRRTSASACIIARFW